MPEQRGAWWKQNRAQYNERIRKGLCRKCGQRKPRKDRVTCHMCKRWQVNQYAERRTAIRASQKKYKETLRDAAFTAYGGYVCACCGDKHREFLTLDHVDGGGSAHRRIIGAGSSVIHLWLKRNNYPKNFRVLCMNCNFSYGMRGYCPHQKEKADV